MVVSIEEIAPLGGSFGEMQNQPAGSVFLIIGATTEKLCGTGAWAKRNEPRKMAIFPCSVQICGLWSRIF